MQLWSDKVKSEELMNTFTASDGFNPRVDERPHTDPSFDSARRLNLADVIAEKNTDRGKCSQHSPDSREPGG